MDDMTPAERAAKMNAYPTHVVYMTRSPRSALITQSYCEVVSETAETVTFESVSGLRTIPREDMYLIKDGRVTPEEMAAVFAEHGHKQRDI